MPHQPEPFAFVQIPKVYLMWPLVAAGIILVLLHWLIPETVTERVMGTIWFPLLVVVFIAIAENFRATHTIVIFVVVVAVVGILGVIALYYHIPMLSWLLQKMKITTFTMNATFLFVFSATFSLIFLGYGVDIRIRRIWITIQGFMLRKIWLNKPEEQVISSPYKVTEDFPDMMDGVILGILGIFFGHGMHLAGDLVITHNGVEVRRIPMVFAAKVRAERIQPFQAAPTEEQESTTHHAPPTSSHHHPPAHH